MGVGAPAGTTWSGEMLGRKLERMTPEAAAEAMLAEKHRLNRNTRLTWNKGETPLDNPDNGKFVGEVCLSLPYVFVDRKFYIQNCRVFRSNGTEISMEQLFKEVDGALYLRVDAAYQEHLAQAVVHDPQLCKSCKLFRAKTPDDMLRHLISDHPDLVAKMAGIEEQAPADDEVKPWCETCNRTFKNPGGLNLHRLKVHDQAA